MTDPVEKLYRACLRDNSLVTKVSAGVITPIKTSNGLITVKSSVIPAGLFLQIRGSGAVQDLYVYTADRGAVNDAVRGWLNQRYRGNARFQA